MYRSWRAELLVGVPEGVAELLPGLLVGWERTKLDSINKLNVLFCSF